MYYAPLYSKQEVPVSTYPPLVYLYSNKIKIRRGSETKAVLEYGKAKLTMYHFDFKGVLRHIFSSNFDIIRV